MQLLAPKVSADCYTRPSGIVSLLMLTITYIHTGNGLTYTQLPISSHLHMNELFIPDAIGWPGLMTSVGGTMNFLYKAERRGRGEEDGGREGRRGKEGEGEGRLYT